MIEGFVSKQLVLDWLGGYAGPQEPEFFAEFLNKLEWRIKNEADSLLCITPEMMREAVPNWMGLGWMWAEKACAVLNRKLAEKKQP